jgi:hypothetical protein
MSVMRHVGRLCDRFRGHRAVMPSSDRPEARTQQVELCDILEADEIGGRLPQMEHLPFGKSLQIGKHGHGLLPVMAQPGKWVEPKAEVFASNPFQQSFGRFAGAAGVRLQFWPFTGNGGGIGRLESRPEAGQAKLLP